MSWQDQLKGDPITWLLQPDNPGVRYLALRDLLDKPADDPEFISACSEAHQNGAIAGVLDNIHLEGYWAKPGPGYTAKYRSTAWTIILLAQLGARLDQDERIDRGCRYLMEHSFSPGGQFSVYGTPSSTIDCLQGNLLWALLEIGYADPRLEAAFDWMARTVTGEGLASRNDKDAERRYYAYKCGPLFACGPNYGQPCAWGGVKVMLAFGKLPESQRSPLIKQAIQEGLDFFLGIDPATAAWPTRLGDKPSRNWWKFGFPVFYITDLLQLVEGLVVLGYGKDPLLANTLELIRDKQDENGRWLLEYDYTGKTWGNYGDKKQPNKWVTLRAMRALKRAASG
ncbi:MAG: nitrogen fixation protein NifH [Anaerolineales bacterium]|nr:nitrogen fixation protein NifH [Anaerolineae bacterium]PWB55534.1 MAG: nitrogen fixation protein NifH [Anaerolineales bacterium]